MKIWRRLTRYVRELSSLARRSASRDTSASASASSAMSASATASHASAYSASMAGGGAHVLRMCARVSDSRSGEQNHKSQQTPKDDPTRRLVPRGRRATNCVCTVTQACVMHPKLEPEHRLVWLGSARLGLANFLVRMLPSPFMLFISRQPADCARHPAHCARHPRRHPWRHRLGRGARSCRWPRERRPITALACSREAPE